MTIAAARSLEASAKVGGIQELLAVRSRGESADDSPAALISSMQPPSVVPPGMALEAGTAPVFSVHTAGGLSSKQEEREDSKTKVGTGW